MRTKHLIATLLMTVMLSAGGASAQSSGDVRVRAQVIVTAPSIARRQSVQDLVEDLQAAGFTYIEIRRTFLGRARIIAYSATEMREVVLNPTTGEVLRDLVQESADDIRGKANNRAAAQNGNKGGNGNNNNAGGADRD